MSRLKAVFVHGPGVLKAGATFIRHEIKSFFAVDLGKYGFKSEFQMDLRMANDSLIRQIELRVRVLDFKREWSKKEPATDKLN